MKPVIRYKTSNNVYYDKSPDMFMRLVKLMEDHPYSYGRMLRAKGRRRLLEKNPNIVSPHKDLNDWINAQLPKLSGPFFKISTKCHWILNGLTDFPVCSHIGCEARFNRINVEANTGYPSFCLRHSKCDLSTIEKRKATCQRRFGVDSPMRSEEIKARCAATNIRNIGYATPLASPIHREKGKRTRIERYGDENYHNGKQAGKTFSKHAAEDPAFMQGIREKTFATNERNGHIGIWTNRELASETRRENNDGKFWTDEMTRKANETRAEKRRSNPRYDDEIREKAEKSTFESIGVKCALTSDKAKTALKNWITNHGGIDNAFQTEYAKKKSRDTMNERYGVDHAMQSPELRQKIDFRETCRKGNETKRRNGTFNTSKSEEKAYVMLCEKFGTENVERQYSSEKYPFRCDFYVRLLDLYVECNFHWTHGGHWFDPDCQEDIVRLEKWKAKHTKFYDLAVVVWTKRDVEKRKAAETNELRYFVAWKLSDLKNFLEK